ncbi:hypothetical protein HDV00_003585 [Rhizophlyctis rosea]|nr:hypothetical protein HDV00_003585 [Rhizophlyctis rosea]
MADTTLTDVQEGADRNVEKIDDTKQTDTNPVLKRLSWLDRALPFLVLLCMVVGVLIGVYGADVDEVLETATIADVSLPIAIGLLWMMYPVLCKVKYEELPALFRTRKFYKILFISLLLNWVFAPLLMSALAWATLPDLPGYRSGIMLVGVARCVAMVLIWNHLAGGDAEWCAVLVAFNSILQVILYSPYAYFFSVIVGKGESVHVDMWLVLRSVLIFLGVPLLAGMLTRLILRRLCRRWLGAKWYDEKFIPIIAPTALLGLLFTILIMFALQGHHIIDDIGSVVRTAVPLVLYFFITFALTLALCRYLRLSYPVSVTQSFTAASNNFELAIAVSVATFGIDSPQALATVIGALIEVPVLLALVYAVGMVRNRWWADVGDVEVGHKREEVGKENGEVESS